MSVISWNFVTSGYLRGFSRFKIFFTVYCGSRFDSWFLILLESWKKVKNPRKFTGEQTFSYCYCKWLLSVWLYRLYHYSAIEDFSWAVWDYLSFTHQASYLREKYQIVSCFWVNISYRDQTRCNWVESLFLFKVPDDLQLYNFVCLKDFDVKNFIVLLSLCSWPSWSKVVLRRRKVQVFPWSANYTS